MNTSIQVLRLAFLVGSLFNNLGCVENAVVGQRSQGELSGQNLANSMKSRRMMLGIGSEVSPFNIWGYLDPESENTRKFVKRHENKRSSTTLQPKILLEDDSGVSEKASTAQSSNDSNSSALQSNSKRSHKGGQSEVKRNANGISPEASNISRVDSKIVLSLPHAKRAATGGSQQHTTSKGTGKIVLKKRSEVTGSDQPSILPRDSNPVMYPRIVLGKHGKRYVPNTGASKMSTLESDILLKTHGKRSTKISSSSQQDLPTSSTMSKKTKRSGGTPVSVDGPASSGTNKKMKRYEFDVTTENFAKPLPIFQEY